MNCIREARVSDAKDISRLLGQMDYLRSEEFVTNNLKKMLSDNSYKIIVYQQGEQVVGLITLHFYWQIVYAGEVGTIGFFVVDETIRNQGIGKTLEDYITKISKERNCALIEVYSSMKRIKAHPFYERQGYKAYDKFFMKEINEDA